MGIGEIKAGGVVFKGFRRLFGDEIPMAKKEKN
jgi:hypothetical protein